MSSPEHKRYMDAIMRSLAEINPHTSDEGRIAYVYAAGYLASYLASLMQEDPFIYTRFIKHIKKKKR